MIGSEPLSSTLAILIPSALMLTNACVDSLDGNSSSIRPSVVVLLVRYIA